MQLLGYLHLKIIFSGNSRYSPWPLTYLNYIKSRRKVSAISFDVFFIREHSHSNAFVAPAARKTCVWLLLDILREVYCIAYPYIKIQGNAWGIFFIGKTTYKTVEYKDPLIPCVTAAPLTDAIFNGDTEIETDRTRGLLVYLKDKTVFAPYFCREKNAWGSRVCISTGRVASVT